MDRNRKAVILYFYPRSPCGERHNTQKKNQPGKSFLSTLSLRRATVFNLFANPGSTISIHALLAESDLLPCLISRSFRLFLSTLSLRRATGGGHIFKPRSEHFYPRSPCGERPSRRYPAIPGREISIHALLAESDSPPSITPTAGRNFYPRSPCGERQIQEEPSAM